MRAVELMANVFPGLRSGTLCLVLSVGLGVLASPAHAAGPGELCRSFDPSDAPTPVAAGELRASTERAEQRLQRRGQSPSDAADTLALLELSDTTTGSGNLGELAAYCAAAGEAMRADRRGSEFRAQAYLLSAFRMAEAAGEPQVASRAAYRLGLVSVNASLLPSTRGESRGRKGTRSAVEDAVEVAAIGDGVCGSLSGVQLGASSPQYVTSLSLECAAVRALTAGDHITATLAQLRLARLSMGLLERDPDQAEFLRVSIGDSLRYGLAAAKGIADPLLRAELTGRLAETALDTGIVDPALADAIERMRTDGAGDPTTAAFGEALAARMALRNNDRDGAQAAANRAVFLEAQRPLPLRLADWYLVLADAEPENRAAHSIEAYRALEAVRPLLPPTDSLTEESTFSLRMRKVFEQAVDVTLASADASDARVIPAAQSIIEAYREAEIQSIFGSECVPPRVSFTPADLAAGEVLLYPILLRDRLELVVAERPAGGGPARYRRLPPNRAIDRQHVAALVEQVNLAMSYGDNDLWRDPARELDRLLIEPIADSLGPDSTLIVIPDGPLRALPFAALPDATGKYLIERTRLGVSPALGYSQPGAGARDSRLRVVAASLQQQVEILGGVFPALAGTTDEARIAAAAGTQSGSMLIEDFRRDDLAQALRGGAIDVLHLATHASFNGGSDRSFIVANGEAIPLSDLRQMIAANLARGGALDLIVLSACETAVGDDEASMGLAGAAVQAGAASAIASLWQVNDTGTAELMRQFYARYHEGQSKADALRGAQLAVLANPDFADPNIWAAFTLLGGWR